MARHGKRFDNAQKKVEFGKRHSLDEALKILPEVATAKFDETVDIAMRLGVDPKVADQMVRGAISLPYGIGKSVRVAVFANGEAAKAATEAGADFVGDDDLIEKIQNEGFLDFDKAIAVRSLMAKVGRLGKVLGPRGLMPNPKTGTVVGPEEVAAVVQEVKGGRVDFRVEKEGIVHAPIGKVSMGGDKLRANILSFVGRIVQMKPASSKGIYLKSVAISSTMGPGIRLDPNEMMRLCTEVQ